ncbi:class I SAM-dependent methyltransferase [candidate division KSB1 bacterium]|nr:class I SAM-dependent methyltransferase [candidate division KSB1 bacterium]NIR70085.1 class I SAM-dependent methyltransferase [candidate division KSB1 bacterium]NIS24435.1 class I SAM-dependent methyltransferase [candidate division KSB1 bacterium]NIT71371.1 class I SAM-dependent methyltransferase [candidate division KSB1 bacterium]NIU25050.1 class I SAM-dependent methyltransferase [candidate division KSB1 bacterium]
MSSKDYFDSIAQQWDSMRQCFFSEAVREKALVTAEIQPGKLAADIGAGSGFITESLIRNGLKVIAVDQSQAMLAEMKKRFPKEDAIDYRIGFAEALPIADTEVDFVFANMYLHHVETPPLAVKEMVRILKPAGKLVITDLDAHEFEFLRTEQHDRWLGFKREDIRKWFEDADLKNVYVDCIGENCCAQSTWDGEFANVRIFVASAEK